VKIADYRCVVVLVLESETGLMIRPVSIQLWS